MSVKLNGSYRRRINREYDKWMKMGYVQGHPTVIRVIAKRVIKYCIPHNTPRLELFDFRELSVEGWDNIVGLMSRSQNILYLNPQYLPNLDFNKLWDVLIHEIGHYYGLTHDDAGMTSHMEVA